MRKIKTLAGLFDAYGGEDGWALRHELEEYLTRKLPCLVVSVIDGDPEDAASDAYYRSRLRVDVKITKDAQASSENRADITLNVTISNGNYLAPSNGHILLSDELLVMALLHANRELPTYMG